MALVLGLAGSLHCAGMCGPLALAIAQNRRADARFVGGLLLYHLGRSGVYAVLGLAMGTLAAGVSLVSVQQVISMVAGVLMVVLAVLTFTHGLHFGTRNRFTRWLQTHYRRLLGNTHSYRTMLAIGALNGLLPCGLVYVALAGAFGTGSTWLGSAYMGVFGLGNMPVLVGISLASTRLRFGSARRIMGTVTLVSGLLLVVRGAGLGIPYLSPEVQLHADATTGTRTVLSCCTPTAQE